MRDFCAALSKVTHTPIPYWLSLPWREVRSWDAAVADLLMRSQRK